MNKTYCTIKVTSKYFFLFEFSQGLSKFIFPLRNLFAFHLESANGVPTFESVDEILECVLLDSNDSYVS